MGPLSPGPVCRQPLCPWVWANRLQNLGPETHLTAGDAVDVMILGKPHQAVVLPEAPFDPKGEKLRA